eukprot:3714-Amorphochlora_amoeboformis.AAC.1
MSHSNKRCMHSNHTDAYSIPNCSDPETILNLDLDLQQYQPRHSHAEFRNAQMPEKGRNAASTCLQMPEKCRNA